MLCQKISEIFYTVAIVNVSINKNVNDEQLSSKSFLSDSSMKVVVNGETSDAYVIIAVIPQESPRS